MTHLRRIILVWNADHGVRGHLRYLADKIRGNEVCELCNITYSGVSKSGTWKRCERDIRAPVDELYRDQVSGRLAELIDGRFPVVAAETSDGFRVLLTPKDIDACDGDPLTLKRALLDALDTGKIEIVAVS